MKSRGGADPVGNVAAMTAKYTVVSDKVGEPGAPFVPEDGINVAALLEGGFIVESKSSKHKHDTEE